MLVAQPNNSHFARQEQATESRNDLVGSIQAASKLQHVLTSGQHDVDISRLVPYAQLPKKIPDSAPTIWKAEDYRGDENRHKWVRHWTEEEITALETAAKAWRESGRPLTEIERATFPLPRFLAETLTAIRHRILHGVGFFLFKGLPVARWDDVELSAIAYLGIGAYLGNAVSQNNLGHILGHVKRLDGADPTQIHKTRIFKTAARQFFHTDSSGGLIGLLCLQTAESGGESDIVSSQQVWNYIQETRPDLAEELASPTWHFDRKGEESPGQRPYYTQPIFSLVRGEPTERLQAHWDPYYVWSLTRHVEAGLIPPTSDKQKEAMQYLEDVAMKLSLHMELEVGDFQLVSDTHVLHSRTAYVDHAPPAPRRHLLRLWLSTPTSEGGWELANAFGDHPRRGGIQVGAQPPTTPIDGQ